MPVPPDAMQRLAGRQRYERTLTRTLKVVDFLTVQWIRRVILEGEIYALLKVLLILVLLLCLPPHNGFTDKLACCGKLSSRLKLYIS